jgi:NAD(P)-dependent dehydrogenase (short-subunit alcohol dehydrogenase family)
VLGAGDAAVVAESVAAGQKEHLTDQQPYWFRRIGHPGNQRDRSRHRTAPGAARRALGAFRRDAGRGETVVAEISAQGGTAGFVATELGGGHVDILVNNAGVFPFGPAHEATEEDFDTVFNLNVKAPFFLVADPVPKMAKRRHGVIVNVSTMVAEFGIPRIAPYVSSKAALVLLTKAWRPSTGPPGSGSTPSALAAPGWADPQRSVPLPSGVTWHPLIGNPIVRRTWAAWPASSRRRGRGPPCAGRDPYPHLAV